MYNITYVPGDGIGPEVMQAMRRVLEASGVKINWHVHNAGASVYKQKGTYLPDDVIESIKKNKVGIKGPITTPFGKGFKSVNVALRKALKTYAIVRPVRSIPNVSRKYPNVDLITIREATEELYSGVEHFVDEEHSAAESIAIVTRKASERLAHFAFKYAIKNKRKKVTVIHKANVLKATMGLFREVAFEVSKRYPQIAVEERVVDNMAQQLVLCPNKYDILLTTNLFGDILSDLAAGLIGGLGLSPGANIGDECALFEPVHGSAPKYAGQNKVNPTAAILTGVMMLRHLNENKAADTIEDATFKVLSYGDKVTYDIVRIRGGTTIGTQEMADEIIRVMNTQ
ncbi:MAG: isocitrate/isopropylmalate dehydrogenase family protein [Candidatus Ranarchaeia archaeon]